jgi:ribosomal protein S18 acetylase RimI-like enzyme
MKTQIDFALNGSQGNNSNNNLTLPGERHKQFVIKNCTPSDADSILALYGAAMSLQTQKSSVVWPTFEKAFIENEIKAGRQWKLMLEGEIACNWAITFNDKEIWAEKDKNDSIYIHRIATNPSYRGNRFIDHIVAWARTYGKSNAKQYVRLDTLGNNTRLIEHYTSAGFTFLGMFRLDNTQGLPAHYQREPNCCLFEMPIN